MSSVDFSLITDQIAPLRISANALLKLQTFTIEFWAIVPPVVSGNNDAGCFFSLDSSPYNYSGVTMLWSANDVYITYGSSYMQAAAGVLKNGSYNFISITSDGTTLKYYLNSTLITSAAYTGAILYKNTDNVIGGKLGSNSSNPPFKGLMSDFRVWNYAKTIEQIDEQKGTRLTGSEPGLVLYLPLDSIPVVDKSINSMQITTDSKLLLSDKTPFVATAIPFTINADTARKTYLPPVVSGYLYDVWTTNTGSYSVSKIVDGVKNDITVGTTPQAICIDRDNVAWVANMGTNTVSRIINGIRVLPDIVVGSSPISICCDKNNAIWVTNSASSTVTKIVNGVVSLTVSLAAGSMPQGICCDKDNTIWVCCYGKDKVARIVNDVKVPTDITVGAYPIGICSDSNNAIYVSNWNNANLSKIVSGVVTTTIAVGTNPYDICIDKDNAIWVTNWTSGDVKKIVNDIVVNTIIVGSKPCGICVDKNNAIWVTCYGSNTITKIANGVVSTPVMVGNQPAGHGDTTGMQAAMLFGWLPTEPTAPISFFTKTDTARTSYAVNTIVVDTKRPTINNFTVNLDTSRPLIGMVTIPFNFTADTSRNTYKPNTGYLYDVWCMDSTTGMAYCIINDNISKGIPVGKLPFSSCVDKDNNLYVVNYGSNNVSKIVNGVVVATIDVGGYSSGICVDKDGAILVTSDIPACISKIVNDKVVDTITDSRLSFGDYPVPICVDQNNAVWAVSKPNSLAKIVNGTVVATVDIGGAATGICVDKNGAVWAVICNNNNVVKIVNDVVVSTIKVGTSPLFACIDKNNAVLVSNNDSKTISKIVNGVVVKTITVEGNPYGICVDNTNAVYVSIKVSGIGPNRQCYVVKLVNDVVASKIPTSNLLYNTGDSTGLQAAMLFGWIPGTLPFNTFCDTTRSTVSDVKKIIVQSDSIRVKYSTLAINSDTLRKLTSLIPFSISTDTSRKLCGESTLIADTTRALTVVLDTNFKRSDIGIKSLTIVTGVQSLSDRFTVETVGKSFGGVDNFKGEVAGFKFSFEKATAGRVKNSRGTTYTVQGRPDMGTLLLRTVDMVLGASRYNNGYVIAATAVQLCNMLGISTNITDFVPLGIGSYDDKLKRFTIKEKTVKSFLDRLFGWSSEFADRQIYYFNRNGRITVQEVGKYTTVYNLDDESKYRIENSTSNEQKITKFIDYSLSNKPKPTVTPGKDTVTPFSANVGFSGAAKFGDASLIYEGGLIMNESTAESSTSYVYEPALHFAFASNKNVLKSKVTLSKDETSRTTTTYEYDIVASSVYSSADVDATLTSERTIVETKNNGAWEIDTDHKTIHVPLGNGFFGQRVEEITKEKDGDKHTTVATSMSRGSSGGLASMYMVQLTNGWVHEKDDPTLPKIKDFDGELVTGFSMPVADIPTLNSLIDKINWMNKRKEETISLSVIVVPGVDLVDAVSGAIIYEGNLYYPQSTNATINERGTRQQINAVRWY